MNYNPDKSYCFLRGSLNIYEIVTSTPEETTLVGNGYINPTPVNEGNVIPLPRAVIQALAKPTLVK